MLILSTMVFVYLIVGRYEQVHVKLTIIYVFFEITIMLTKIISGGQTGVDRGGLDAALKYNFPCGGWCPEGRRAEDGIISSYYPLSEMPTARYLDRTRRNVEDSDGTLIITRGFPVGGTKETINFACRLSKPYMIVDLEKDISICAICAWIKSSHIEVLNVAGPRESKCPGIADETVQLVSSVLDLLLV